MTLDRLSAPDGRARLFGIVGVSDVEFTRTATTLHVVESVPAGGANFLTVFGVEYKNEPQGLIAVFSRHTHGILFRPARGMFMVSAMQVYGYCRVLQ